MYFKKTAVSAAVGAMLLSASAIAQESDSSVYFGVRYTLVNFVDSNPKASVPALIVSVGEQLNPYLAVEARLGLGISNGSRSYMDNNQDITEIVELDAYYGLLGRFGVPVSDTFYPYLQLGLGKAKVSIDSKEGNNPSNLSVRALSEDLSYGAGLNININETFTGNIEYMKYYDDAKESLDGIAIGLEVNF